MQVDASVSGGFDWLKLPDSLETYVSTRLAQYGQVITVRVSTGLFANRYTATVSFIPSTELTADQARAVIADAFTSWNGIPANVSITSSGEPAQQDAGSVFAPVQGLTTSLIVLAALVAVIVVVREVG